MSRMQSRHGIGTAGSMASSVSSISAPELPNLPGVRRDVSLINPKLYRDFKASQGIDVSRAGTAASQQGRDDDNSLLSYFEGSKDYSQILSPFPQNGASYNDLSGRYSLASQRRDRVSKTRSLPYSSTGSIPAFVRDEKRMCCFQAYFYEPARDEVPARARRVNIIVYLEDNSIEIVEPKEENSGTSQGRFLKRHVISKQPSRRPDSPAEPTPEIFTIKDFYAGAELVFYNRTYIVLDADGHTKKLLAEMGITFGTPLPPPDDVYNPKTRAGARTAATRMGRRKGKALHFQYDRKVLRFYGIWDCRNSLFGDELRVKLHYSLAENTIEVVPIHERNSGRDRLPKLLKKSAVTMRPPTCTSPAAKHILASSGEFDLTGGSLSSLDSTGGGGGEDSDGGGGSFMGRRSRAPSRGASKHRPPPPSMEDSVTSLVAQSDNGWVPERPFHWTDLHIGDEIPVASMHVLLVDADEFTREFYNSKNMPLDAPIHMPKPVYPTVTSEVPPYNGFGSEADSLATCRHTLVPMPPPKDGAKLKMLSGMVLRYEATLVDPTEADKSRQFILQVHLEDDTFQIREPPIRNSGHKGGIFLKRTKLETHDGSRPVQPEDFYLGAEVKILTHCFKIHNCDPFSFKFMEEHSDKWVHSNIATIVEKILPKKKILQRLILTMPALSSRSLATDELQELLERAGVDAVKQEACTLFRAVDVYRTGTVKMTKFLKYIMDLDDE